MPQASIAQINVRMPRELKESGDNGLQELGLSPSDAVRALWTRLSYRGEELEKARDFLLGNQNTDSVAKEDASQSVLAKGWDMVNNSVAKLGISAVSAQGWNEGVSDTDLVAQALEDRMHERGLM